MQIIKQKLDNYTDKYKKKEDWKVRDTRHYTFNYFNNSIAEGDIKKIEATQKRGYENIINTLELKKQNKKIKYYFYPSENQKERLMGGDGFAQAIWMDNSIHVVYTDKIKPLGEHEDTHLLTLSWGVAVGFFQEGLAEYLSGCKWGRKKEPSIKFVKKGFKEGKTFLIRSFFSHNSWMRAPGDQADFYYPLACVFTQFLIEDFGLEKYKKLYKKLHRKNKIEKNIIIFEKLYKMNLSNVEKKWKIFINIKS